MMEYQKYESGRSPDYLDELADSLAVFGVAEALADIRSSIFDHSDDTVWMASGNETVCDFISATLGDEKP